jgi:glycosyltransferase involved in cell wall biosynthesis
MPGPKEPNLQDDEKELSRLRVCMVVINTYHGDGRVRRYGDALLEKGARVDALSTASLARRAGVDPENLSVIEVPIRRGDRGVSGYIVEFGTALFMYGIYLAWRHLRRRYDVIHVHNMPDFLVLTALIPRLFGAKLILDVHDPMPEFFMSKFNVNDKAATVGLMRAQERISTRLAHAVIAANPHFKQRLERRGVSEEKITVVMNIPDTSIFDRRRYPRKGRNRGKPFTLLYPGTIAPRYGLDVAIRAVGLLQSRIPNLRLVIVGDHVDYVGELTHLAMGLGLADRVQIRPPVPIEEVPRLMSEADAGLYPALPDPHMNIATPSKVLEYATMGLPIVASRLQVLEDMFADEDLLFHAPGDPQEMADCISKLVEDPRLGDRLVESMDRGFGRNYSWARERQKYLDLLRRIS